MKIQFLPSKRQQYLQTMGVTSWRLRRQIHYYRLSQAGKVSGILAAEINMQSFEAEQQLVAGILKALNMQLEQIQPPIEGPVICLGRTPATVNTYSPAEMLANPQLKGPVWRALQEFFGLKKV